jgi:TonB family protein
MAVERKHTSMKLHCATFILAMLLQPAFAGSEIVPPRVYRTVKPAIQPEACADGALARLRVTTNAYGFVTAIEILEATDPAFGQACTKAVSRWRYFPAREGGMPVPATFIQPVRLAGRRHAATAEPLVLFSAAP